MLFLGIDSDTWGKYLSRDTFELNNNGEHPLEVTRIGHGKWLGHQSVVQKHGSMFPPYRGIIVLAFNQHSLKPMLAQSPTHHLDDRRP